jgi:hypothetical protein
MGVADPQSAIIHNARTGGRVKHYTLVLIVGALLKITKNRLIANPILVFLFFVVFRSI